MTHIRDEFIFKTLYKKAKETKITNMILEGKNVNTPKEQEADVLSYTKNIYKIFYEYTDLQSLILLYSAPSGLINSIFEYIKICIIVSSIISWKLLVMSPLRHFPVLWYWFPNLLFITDVINMVIEDIFKCDIKHMLLNILLVFRIEHFKLFQINNTDSSVIEPYSKEWRQRYILWNLNLINPNTQLISNIYTINELNSDLSDYILHRHILQNILISQIYVSAN